MLFQVNPHTHQVKLCDFGSAKVLVFSSSSVLFLTVEHLLAIEQYIMHGWMHKTRLTSTTLNSLLHLCYCSCSCRWRQVSWPIFSFMHGMFGSAFLFCLNFFIIIHDRSKTSQIYHIFVLVIIEHLSLYLGQLNTLLPLTYGLWVVFLLNCFLDRFSIQDKKFYLFFYFLAGNGFTFCCFFLSVWQPLL